MQLVLDLNRTLTLKSIFLEKDISDWNQIESSHRLSFFHSLKVGVSPSLPGRSFTKPGGYGTTYAK